MALFKNSGTFSKYAHSLAGNDSTGDGSRTNPYQTLTKCIAVGGTSILANGVFNENVVNLAGIITGDTSETRINGNVSSVSGSGGAQTRGLILMQLSGTWILNEIVSYSKYLTCERSIINTVSGYTDNANVGSYFRYLFIENFNVSNLSTADNRNITVNNFKNYATAVVSVVNWIIVNSIDLYNFTLITNTSNYPLFKYCLFRKSTLWKWNGTTITINWTTNLNTLTAYANETLLERVYQSLLYYANSLSSGTAKTYFLAILATNTTIFYADTNGQTNKVADDVANPIFNMYNGSTPVDYSLKLDANNVALTMSDNSSYIGSYKANLGGFSFGSIVNVNADGTDDAVTTPTLLVSDGYNQFSANDASTQSRNRIRTTVVAYPRGKSFAGAGSQLTSGIASRLGFGKNRPMVTTGTGNTVPPETFEFIPYDSVPADNSAAQANNISGKSSFPCFSCSFNGNTQMWYKPNGTPLLFNDLATYSITTDLNLAEYGTWAVTSADAEDYNLSLIATANSLTKKNIPVVCGKQELNLNFF